MKKVLHRNHGWVSLFVVLGVFLCIVAFAGRNVFAQEIADKLNITLFYRVRFEILGQSPKGLYYIDLFDRYTGEITQTALNHPSLMVESLSVLQTWEPNLEALVNGRGNAVEITKEQVEAVTAYLDHLSELASPALKSVLDDERSTVPLESTVRMTMNQAWSFINQDSRFPGRNTQNTVRIAPVDLPSNPVAWTLPQSPQYAIDFDPKIWELATWDNSVTTSWEFKHRSLYECVVTSPRLLSDPYSPRVTSAKTLGNTPYEIQLSRFSELVLYVVYTPLFTSSEWSERPQQNQIVFIVYPGSVDTQACIDQSEALLGTIHLSP